MPYNVQGSPYPYQQMPTQAPYPGQPQYPLAPQPGPTGQPQAPAYGLAGANAALSGNIGGGPMQKADYGQINANRDMATGFGNQGIQAVEGYNQAGQQANQQQAAFSGALGQQAQQQAYSNYAASPGQQWLQDQALRGVTRNAAAIGGLGGGNVMQELQRQAMGLSAQDFQNNFNRLGAVGDRGMQAAQLQNSLYQQNANAADRCGLSGGRYSGVYHWSQCRAERRRNCGTSRSRKGQRAIRLSGRTGHRQQLQRHYECSGAIGQPARVWHVGYVRQLHEQHCQPVIRCGWTTGTEQPKPCITVGEYR